MMIGSNRHIKYVCLFLVIITMLSFFGSANVIAADEDEDLNPVASSLAAADEHAEKVLKNPVKKGIYNFTKYKYINVSFLGELLSPLFEGDLISETTLKGINAGISSIAKLMCFLYFLLDLLEHATRDTFTAETFVKSFAKLIIMFVLFEPTNMNTLIKFGADLNRSLLDTMTEGVALTKLMEYIDTLDKTSWIKCIGYLFENSMNGIAMLVSIAVVALIGLGRTMEIAIYTAFMPLGIAPIYNGGLNSSGFRYLKKLIALYLQGAIMYGIFLVATSATSFTADYLGMYNAGADLVLTICTIGVLAKSKSIANDIVGV